MVKAWLAEWETFAFLVPVAGGRSCCNTPGGRLLFVLHEALKVISVHPMRVSPCLLLPAAAAQTWGLQLQSRMTKSVECAAVPVPRLFGWRDLLVPSLPVDVVERRGCLGWNREHRQAVGQSCLPVLWPPVQTGLWCAPSSSCAVKQVLKYCRCSLSLGAMPLLAGLAVCAQMLAVLFPSLVCTPVEAAGG